MMIYDPAREWYRTDARLAIEAVRKNTAPSLLNIFAMLSSNLKVYRSSRLPSFTQGVSLMIFSMAYGALVTTSLLKSIIDGDL